MSRSSVAAFARPVFASLSFVLLCALSAPAAAQNGSNYHVLSNSPESSFVGVGAGGSQTADDGLGTYIPGEDLRGSLGSPFAYRNVSFLESICVFGPGASGFVQIRFPGLYFFELEGLNPNVPAVFTNPVCTTPLTASFVPYGVGPASTVSFVAAQISVLGPTHTVLLPDNGLLGGGGGAATLIAAGSGKIPGGSGSIPTGCYFVQFTWAASALSFQDGIDGLWHYAVNSDDGNQYWQLSTDEMNLWQSNTVGTDGGVSTVQSFLSVMDYGLLLTSSEANTHAILAPHGIEQAGPYYSQTENMVRAGEPNGGFDVGRGSRAVSFSGLGGVKVPPALGGLGNGAQDPAYGPGGTVPTLGFATWDNKPNQSAAGFGSKRVTWVSVDLAQIEGRPPTPGVTEAGGSVRLPVEVDGYPQPLTERLFARFMHETKSAPSGWPHPFGLPSGSFGNMAIGGGSLQVPLANFVSSIPCNVGVAIDLQYGTTGFDPNNPTQLTFDPQKADISGRKELYLFP